MTSRREFLSLIAAAAGMSGCAGARPGAGRAALPPSPLAGIATSLREELEYRPSVDGAVPREIRGTLYRNGPGLFDRGGDRRRHLLDGDGMVQAFDFVDGKVRFRNRFVRTEKFVAEERAGRFLYPTWSTPAPGGWLANLGYPGKSQAGVTVVMRNDRLLAFDDGELPYALAPETLATLGAVPPVPGAEAKTYNAHTKVDGHTGEWVLFSQDYGPTMKFRVTVADQRGELKRQLAFASPRYTYLHDFFVTPRYVVFSIHALEFSPYLMLLGVRTVMESFAWRPEDGNIVAVIDKDGGSPPLFLEAPASFMWHSVNAYERGAEIIAEFVGYDSAEDFFGDDSALAAIMRGEEGRMRYPGTIRRYVIDPRGRSLREETVSPGGHEFPYVNPQHMCHDYRFAYLTATSSGAAHDSALARVDMRSGAREVFDFGKNCLVGEPVFIPRPHARYAAAAAHEAGWLASEVFDASAQRSFLALLRSDAVADGPIAKLSLTHHVPYSFHGCWHRA